MLSLNPHLSIPISHSLEWFLSNSGVDSLMTFVSDVLAFFVVEAKSKTVELNDCLPQILAQLYASAKKLKYDPILIC